MSSSPPRLWFPWDWGHGPWLGDKPEFNNVAVSATGNPNAVVTVQVGTQVSGVVVALFADFNSKVTKGELIARIDPAPFQAKVDQAQANVLKAEAIAEDDKVEVDRRVIMVKQGADAKEDLETAQTTYRSAVADHDALVAQQHAMEDSVKVAQAQLNVTNSLLTANQAQVK